MQIASANIPFIIIIISLGVAGAAGLVFYSLVPVKSEITSRLEQAENLSFTRLDERKKAYEKIFTEKQRSALSQKLLEAGWYTVSPAKMGARIIAGAILGGTLAIVFIALIGEVTPLYGGIALFVTFGGAYFPYSKLGMAVKARQTRISVALPDLLDMLSTTVQAGLAFNQAIAQSIEVVDGPLADEVRAVLSEVRLGRSRADALKSMAARCNVENVTQMATAIIQAERLGSTLSTVLEDLGEDVRNARMSRAEELANLMPSKMVIPMALFMLPALFVMIFGGVAAQYFAQPH